MRRRYRKAAWLLGAAAVMAFSGCSTMTQREKLITACAGYGALAGGTAGAVTGAVTDASDNLWWALPLGVVGGAIIGATVCGLTSAPTVLPVVPPPKPPTPPPPPPAPKPRHKIVLRGVHFAFNKANIRPADGAVLDEAADVLSHHPNVTVEVDGYCDAIGGVAYNLRLSQRRADAVASYLENHGIAAGRLIPQGFGKTHFVATNDTAAGRAENRRVELVPVQ